jgi:hypothetical protein
VAWRGEVLSLPRHQIWARKGTAAAETPDDFSADPTMVGFLIEDCDGEAWRYRRDPRITRALEEFGVTRHGFPIVRPEVALLFKAKGLRYKDQRDFEQLVPRLDAAARAWLSRALDVAHPGHPWSGL